MHRPLIVVATPQGQLGNTLVHFAHLRAFAMEKRLPLVHLAFDRYAPLFPAADRDLFASYAPDLPIYDEPLVLALIGLFKTFLSIVVKGGNAIRPELAKEIMDSPPRVITSLRSPEMRSMLMTFGCALSEWVTNGQFRSLPIDLLRVEGADYLDLSTDPRVERLMGEQRMMVFDGWSIRDPASFAAHKHDLMEYFTPAAEINAEIDRAIAVARRSCTFLIGVHIRRGDYKEYMGGRYFFELAQYARWMAAVRDGLPEFNLGFMVCSDEKFTKDTFAGLPVEFGPGSAVGDMYALARCDAIIGPPSTFTGWAASQGSTLLWYFERAGQPVDELIEYLRKATPNRT